jgi:formylglycine-generating enzyme required for sulfatase activity
MPKRYNLVNIRALLIEGFTAAELRDFCYDTPGFKAVHYQLAENTDKAEIVQKLLVHAEQKLLLDELLAWAEAQNPARYASHQPYLEDDPSLIRAGLVPAPIVETSPAVGTSPTPTPLQPAPSPLRVFLCHAAADKPAVRELYHRLRSDGFQPWLDEEDLLPGQKRQREIPKAVAASDVVVVCLSNAALTKAGYVQDEIKFALDATDRQPEETIFLIPLRLEECDVPDRLAGLHWVNFFDPRGYERLLRALRAKAEAKAKAEVESRAEVKPAPGRKPPVKPRPKIPPGDTCLGGMRDEVAMAYYREYLSGLGGETKLEQKIAEPQSQPQTLPRRFDFEPEMILIPAGEFLMGSDPKKDKYALENEQPQHTLYLPDYYMAKTPVTNAQYAAFVKATGHRAPHVDLDWAKPYIWRDQMPPTGKENHPVVLVSWNDAVAYCRWLAEATGRPYRLPAEAEWEKGARGTDGHIYPWGNKWDAKWCNSAEGGKKGTTPVDAYPAGASPYGLLDMAGNVWEWCSTIWQDKAYPFQVQDEWTKVYLDRTNVLRVMRGGAFGNYVRFVRCAARLRNDPGNGGSDVGFRVVVSPFS